MCYTIPLAGAIITSAGWKGRHPQVKLLNLMFLGGSIFGVVDHLWNGELLLVGDNLIKDLALGLLITLAILITWKIVLMFNKKILADL